MSKCGSTVPESSLGSKSSLGSESALASESSLGSGAWSPAPPRAVSRVREPSAWPFLWPSLAALCLGLLSACAQPEYSSVELKLVPTLAGQPLSCEQAHNLDGRTWTLSSLLVFVHRLRLVDGQGHEQPLILDPDGRWQQEGLALLDFESGLNTCDNGTSALNPSLKGRVAPGRYQALRAILGVPFEQNHADPMQAQAPLTETSMHWGWQGGYKFFRLDGRLDGRPVVMHLGSTGCTGKIGQIEGCQRPNRAPISWQGFVLDVPEEAAAAPLQVQVPWPLDALLSAPAAASADEPALGCMGTPEEPGCLSFFDFFHLDLATGLPKLSSATQKERP